MTVPLVAIPWIAGPDLLRRCIRSIDADVGRVLVIDNSTDGAPDLDGVFVAEMPHNLGFAASVNLAIRTHADLPWWCIANADTEFAPGDLERLADEMARPGPRWVGIQDWRVYGVNYEAVEAVGFMDENFHPAYCEDADYEYRCTLAGVPWYFIEGGTSHVGSATIADPRYGRQNARSYPSNRARYRDKWGGDLRGGERFTTPFDQGGSLGDWRLDIRRLRENDWR